MIKLFFKYVFVTFFFFLCSFIRPSFANHNSKGLSKKLQKGLQRCTAALTKYLRPQYPNKNYIKRVLKDLETISLENKSIPSGEAIFSLLNDLVLKVRDIAIWEQVANIYLYSAERQPKDTSLAIGRILEGIFNIVNMGLKSNVMPEKAILLSTNAFLTLFQRLDSPLSQGDLNLLTILKSNVQNEKSALATRIEAQLHVALNTKQTF